MAPKKKTEKLELSREQIGHKPSDEIKETGGAAIIVDEPAPSSKPSEAIRATIEKRQIKHGWVLKGDNGRFVNAEGFWVSDSNAAMFFSDEAAASAHNKSHCENLYQAVEV